MFQLFRCLKLHLNIMWFLYLAEFPIEPSRFIYVAFSLLVRYWVLILESQTCVGYIICFGELDALKVQVG